ncbi:hypothetical protein ACLOJK_019937 [Asimina triloba]
MTALKDPSKFLEQANAVLSSNLESTNFEDTSCLLPEYSNQTADANCVDNQQKRRPALGLRRAKFSFKPTQSQPVPLPDPVLSIDHLKDPGEFFAACERLETFLPFMFIGSSDELTDAEKELKKSRGDTLVDPFEKPKDRKVRLRRQGILGKMASYKHIYPKSAGKVNPVSSQEEMSQVSHFNMTLEAESNKSQPESATQHTESQEAEMVDVDVVAAKEKQGNRINVLLEELLSTCVDLEGGEMVSLLQERLHVKPVALDELSFPDLDIIQRNDIKAFEESQSQPRKALSDLQQGLRLTASGKTPARKTSVKKPNKDESFRYPQSSLTPPRSPFASLSVLTKRILQKDRPSDPFALPVEADGQAAERSCSFEGRVDKQALLRPASPNHLEKRSLSDSDDSTQRNDGKSNDEMLSKMDKECNAANIAFSSEKVSSIDLAVSLDTPMEGDACPQDKVKDVPPAVPLSQESEISLDVITGTAQCSKDRPEPEKVLTPDLAVSVNTYMDNTSSRFDIEIDAISSEAHAHSRDKPQVNDMPPVVPSSQELESSHVVITGTAQCSDSQPEPDNLYDGGIDVITGTAKCSEDQPEPVIQTSMVGHFLQAPAWQQMVIQKAPQTFVDSMISTHAKKDDAVLLPRVVELMWMDIVIFSGWDQVCIWGKAKQSNKIKTARVLERGKSFPTRNLYMSNSQFCLPTIIGIKNASPDKGGAEPALKVKSFVSEEYAELVRLAALH